MVRRHAALAALTLGALAACANDQPAPLAPTALRAVTDVEPDANRAIVTFTTDAVPADFSARVAALGGSVVAAYDGAGVAIVAGVDDAAVASLAGSKGVTLAKRDAIVQLDEPRTTAEVDATDVDAASPGAPNLAARYAFQWSYKAISADKAWAAGVLGSPSVTVAILDTGIDPYYPDLAGLVDATRSRSFVPSDNALIATFFPTGVLGQPVPAWADLNFHGSHVASTVSSNANIIAGVTSKTKLMAVKVLGASGSGSFSGILQGVMFAADQGADVINMSIGGGLASKQEDKDLLKALNRTMQYAAKKGVVTVVAAGNESENLDVKEIALLCELKSVICVSATGPVSAPPNGATLTDVDVPAIFTNYGRTAIAVAAPGGNYAVNAGGFLTTGGFVYQACSKERLNYNRTTRVFTKSVCALNPARHFISGAVGTSMASPHAAGLAALMVAKYGKKNPEFIRTKIEGSSDDLGENGKDPFYGTGRINVARALGL